MKSLLIAIIVILLFGCGTTAKKDDTSAKGDSIEQNSQTADKDYLIRDSLVGKFKIGKPIPFPGTSDNYEISQELLTRMTEEGPEEEVVYKVRENGSELLSLLPTYDFETDEFTRIISEIIVLSHKYKTNEGIGVGSTITEFINQYPDYSIWFTYVSEMYVIETEELDVQFILNGKDFIGDLDISSEMTDLKISDFNQNAVILKVRIL